MHGADGHQVPANWRIVPFWNRYAGSMQRPAGLTAAENILDRDFKADRPGQKMVSDITYIPTNEGWLCLAVVMDLLGNKIVGISMDGRMTKELVIAALKDAVRHTRSTEGCILHSDRGSQISSIRIYMDTL